MNNAVEQMLKRYEIESPTDAKNALREIIQEIALLGLARQNFFSHAAFYGGTALRIAHGLNRFSEDLDFTLIEPADEFRLTPFLKGIEQEFSALGMEVNATKKDKKNKTTVDSAFIKTNTLNFILEVGNFHAPLPGIHRDELMKVKLEIDTDPPQPSGIVESKTLMLPIPFSYKILALPSLFGGKLHALLCRHYRGARVKGRDYYDFIWYANKKVVPDLDYLEAKLHQSGNWSRNEELDYEGLRELLVNKFSKTNWEQAKSDVNPFIKDDFELNVWSTEFFTNLINNIIPES